MQTRHRRVCLDGDQLPFCDRAVMIPALIRLAVISSLQAVSLAEQDSRPYQMLTGGLKGWSTASFTVQWNP